MGDWNFGDVWEAVADAFGGEVAAIHGERGVTWSELDARADGVALALLDAGLGRQQTVAQYQRNGPEYLEVMFAAFKAGLVPVNTNYRYGDDELAYLWDDSDAAAVVFDAEFTEVCARLRSRLPGVRAWLRVGGEGDCPAWATPYAQAAATSPGRVVAPWGRTGDDLFLIYTGGTTGMPKGVMWRQDDLFAMLEGLNNRPVGDEADPKGYAAAIARPGPRVLPAAPLMHGTAAWFAMPALSRAGSVVTLTGHSFDPDELLDAVVARQVRGLGIVGDAFAKPIVRRLDAEPGRWDVSHLRVVFSSGVMFSQETKNRLLAHAPRAIIVDSLGSSESGGLARSVTTAGEAEATARFRLGPNTRVIDDDGRDVVPGSGQRGKLAVGGRLPLGYHKDPAKTADTFVELDGRRYVVAGDWAEVAADGVITLLGRGSGCINTGGEKVYPEEVEEALKTAPGVHDAAVVGVPDERFGQAVVALVELAPGEPFDEAGLIAHVKTRLAHYKAPRRVLRVPSTERAVNGKLDYRRLTQIAREAVGA